MKMYSRNLIPFDPTLLVNRLRMISGHLETNCYKDDVYTYMNPLEKGNCVSDILDGMIYDGYIYNLAHQA